MNAWMTPMHVHGHHWTLHYREMRVLTRLNRQTSQTQLELPNCYEILSYFCIYLFKVFIVFPARKKATATVDLARDSSNSTKCLIIL